MKMKSPLILLLATLLFAVSAFAEDADFPKIGAKYNLKYPPTPPTGNGLNEVPNPVAIIKHGSGSWYFVEYEDLILVDAVTGERVKGRIIRRPSVFLPGSATNVAPVAAEATPAPTPILKTITNQCWLNFDFVTSATEIK